MSHWLIETTCAQDKRVVFEINKEGVVKVTEQDRDVSIRELVSIHDMVRMMESVDAGITYKHMECNKQIT